MSSYTRRVSLPTPKIGWKEIRDTIFKIGYTLEGRFDPEHLDFQGFCFCCHVHTLARVLAILNLVVSTASIVYFIFTFRTDIKSILITLNYVLPIISAPTIVIAVFWTKQYKWIIPYMIYMFFYLLFLIYMMVYCGIKVFNPDHKNSLSKDTILTEQLISLINLIVYSFTFLIGSLQFITLYTEYCYLKGKNMLKQSQNNV